MLDTIIAQDVSEKEAITQLSLTHFRNYSALQLAFDGSGSVVLTGHNGAGKTNILEAISLLAPGRGLRRAKLGEMVCQHAGDGAMQQGWVVHTKLMKQGEVFSIGTALDWSQQGNEKRVTKIDGDVVRNQEALLDYLSVVWVTPQMNQMFSEGHGLRRRFLDRLAYGFDKEHASRVASYEHAMRERNRLLGRGGADAVWLGSLEQKMAEQSVAIAACRLMVLQQMAHWLSQPKTDFPAAQLHLEGVAEQALQEDKQAIDIEEMLREALEASRAKDASSGRSSYGAHKSQFHVWYAEKKQEALYCSTGEQKALLLSIILAYGRAHRAWRGVAPILLLDEVVAHLDVNRRKQLFEEVEAMQAQAWMTGTDAADFSAAEGMADFRQIKDGKLL